MFGGSLKQKSKLLIVPYVTRPEKTGLIYIKNTYSYYGACCITGIFGGHVNLANFIAVTKLK